MSYTSVLYYLYITGENNSHFKIKKINHNSVFLLSWILADFIPLDCCFGSGHFLLFHFSRDISSGCRVISTTALGPADIQSGLVVRKSGVMFGLLGLHLVHCLGFGVSLDCRPGQRLGREGDVAETDVDESVERKVGDLQDCVTDKQEN